MQASGDCKFKTRTKKKKQKTMQQTNAIYQARHKGSRQQ